MTITKDYNETRNKYKNHRKNMILAEKDILVGVMQEIMQEIPIVQKKITKRTLILFVRDYLIKFERVSATGLARKYEGIYANKIKKPNNQLVKIFTIILNELVDSGILRKYGSVRGIPIYRKIKITV